MPLQSRREVLGVQIGKITIIRRTKALGYAQTISDEDALTYRKEELMARLSMMLSGRAAQQQILKTVDTGAANDFKQAYGTAQKMVKQWGMSSLSYPIFIGDDESEPFLGPTMQSNSPSAGADLLNRIDVETKEIIEKADATALEILTANESALHRIAEVLLEKETILRPEFLQILAEHQVSIKAKDQPEKLAQ